MKVRYTKQFLKGYAKLSSSQRAQVDERILLWCEKPLHPQLRNHKLKGEYAKYHSINITGDIRALYFEHRDEVVFDHIGTHSQLYG